MLVMGPVVRLARAAAVASIAALALAAPAAAHDTGVEVVASGLDNPRGLDIADGTLWVTEAGPEAPPRASPDPRAPGVLRPERCAHCRRPAGPHADPRPHGSAVPRQPGRLVGHRAVGHLVRAPRAVDDHRARRSVDHA